MRTSSAFTYEDSGAGVFLLRETAGREASQLNEERSFLNTLSDSTLLASIVQLRKTEAGTVLSMLLHIGEVESRGLDLSSGYSSIFDFCVSRLKYSESVANRRIRVARAIRKYPGVYGYLYAGKVNICNVSKIAGIMTKENHIGLLEQISGTPTREVDMIVSSHRPASVIRDRVIPVRVLERVVAGRGDGDDPEDGDDLGDRDVPVDRDNRRNGEKPGDEAGGRNSTASAGGKKPCSLSGSSRQDMVEVRQKFKLQFAVSPEFMEKYERVRELLSTKHPGGMDFECVFETCLDEYIEKHSPEARDRRREARERRRKAREKCREAGERDCKAKEKCREAGSKRRKAGEKPRSGLSKVRRKQISSTEKRRAESSRHIPAVVRDEVYRRDGGCCAYRGSDGRRCNSKWNLEIDHIIPFALGGASTPDNLQLLCRKHNQYKGIKNLE